jgi:RHS repeat-associated protein
VIVTDASGRLHLHEDPAANLVLITDDNSTPAERYQYDAFGDPTILNGDGDLVLPASAVDQGPRFGGMPYLGGPGLFAAGARHYDPITGVFLARDPNLHADSPSPYAYCGHNPVGRIDPDGALWGPLLFGVFGAAANVIGLWRSGADFDAWDVFAAGAIGFGAGFVGAATFGRAAAGITRGLLSVAGRAPVALGAKTSIAISVGSGAGAGLVSGGVSGSLAGAAGGAYAGMRGGGDAWDLASSGAAREGVAGMAAGLVGGALFQGSLRAGVLPSGTWGRLVGTARRPPQAWGGRGQRCHLRGLASPAGLGLAGAGFASGFTGGLVNHLQAGGSSRTDFSQRSIPPQWVPCAGPRCVSDSALFRSNIGGRGQTQMLAAHLQRARRHTTGDTTSATSPSTLNTVALHPRRTRGSTTSPPVSREATFPGHPQSSQTRLSMQPGIDSGARAEGSGVRCHPTARGLLR